MDNVLLRVFKNRRGVIPFLTTFASRATVTPFSDDSGVAWCKYEFVYGRLMKCGALEVLMTIAVTTLAHVPDILIYCCLGFVDFPDHIGLIRDVMMKHNHVSVRVSNLDDYQA